MMYFDGEDQATPAAPATDGGAAAPAAPSEGAGQTAGGDTSPAA